jgi:hypothetical protein
MNLKNKTFWEELTTYFAFTTQSIWYDKRGNTLLFTCNKKKSNKKSIFIEPDLHMYYK